MKIDIRANDLILDPSTRTKIECCLHNALERYVAQIGQVAVTVRDVNGPRGGDGFKCQISIHLPQSDRVVVVKSGAEMLPLVKHTAERAAFAVRRNFNRRRTVKRRRTAALR